MPRAVLQRIRTRLGSYWWNALYQQRPSPAEGLLFRKDWIQPPLSIAPGQPRRYPPLVLSCDLSFEDGKQNDACGFALLGLLEPQRHPAAEARRQGLALAANAAGAQGTPRGVNATHSLGGAADPWAELQIEALWAHRQRLDLPGVIKFLLASLASLERQGLRPNAVLIEDAANGPAVCQLLRRQVPGLIANRPKGNKGLPRPCRRPAGGGGAGALCPQGRLLSGGAVGLLAQRGRGRPGGCLLPGGALDRSPVLAGPGLRQLAGADGV